MKRTKIIIEVITNKKTGLLVALNRDFPPLKGLMVHGRTDEELEERIPDAIICLLEAQGFKNVKIFREGDGQDPAFRPSTYKYEAAMNAA